MLKEETFTLHQIVDFKVCIPVQSEASKSTILSTGRSRTVHLVFMTTLRTYPSLEFGFTRSIRPSDYDSLLDRCLFVDN